MSARRDAASPDLETLVRDGLQQSARVKQATLAVAGDIAAAGAILIGALRDGAKVLCFGNGGSAADAQHLASELAGRFVRERAALPALALAANSSDVTAISNDYGFERVFERLVEAHGRAGDVAVAISTSGDSANVNAGAVEARKRGLHAIALTGRGGGQLAGLVDRAVVVPSGDTPRIQETHIAICHLWCEMVDAALFPAEAGSS